MMKWISTFLILICPSFGWSTTITFETKDSLPQNKALYLEDVAVLATEDDYTLGALKGIKVAETAQEAERMTVQDIIKKIRPQLKAIERHCECKLQIHIPKELTQFSLNGAFSEQKLALRLVNSLKEFCTSCEVEIKNSTSLRGQVPDKYTHWTSQINPKELKGPSMVRVYFDDNALNPLVYQMFVSIKKPVLKLAHPLPAGTAISMTDVEKVVVDITNESREFANETDIFNTEIKRSLGAGELLALNDLILKYKVKLGESIKVIVRNSSLEMEMSGVAQKNGRVGDKIPVRLAATKKEVHGEILSDGRVAL